MVVNKIKNIESGVTENKDLYAVITPLTTGPPSTMMNFFHELGQKNQVELSDIVSDYKVDQLNMLGATTDYNPSVAIIHTSSKTNSWANSKSKRFSFIPATLTFNPGPGHYN